MTRRTSLLYEASEGVDGEDEEERIVYYDLDAGSRRTSLLLSPDPVRKSPSQRPRQQKSNRATIGRQRDGRPNTTILERPKEIFHSQQIFNLDGSDGEEDGHDTDDEINPFASLLKPVASMPSSTKAKNKVTKSSPKHVRVTPPQRREKPSESSTSKDSPPSARQKFAQQLSTKSIETVTTRLSFESASARPARWDNTSMRSVGATYRRKSVNLPVKQPTNKPLNTSSRRKSFPVHLQKRMFSLEGNAEEEGRTSKKRRLSDVLHRATVLSQQKTAEHDPALSQNDHTGAAETAEYEDVIVDTEHQMRAESFDTQFFSPTKANVSNLPNRKYKPDAVISKIRGDIGESIRKAIRKTNRDLTLLRSHGQNLLQKEARRHSIGMMDSIQDRPHVIVCLRHLLPELNVITFDTQIHSISPELEKQHSRIVSAEPGKIRIQSVFSPQIVHSLKLTPKTLVKVYTPFHFLEKKAAVGSNNSISTWLLVSTNLSEIVDENHDCPHEP